MPNPPKTDRSERQPIISGLGAVAPNGIGLENYTAALRAGESGVALLDFEHELMASTVAARCLDFDPTSVVAPAEVEKLPRAVPMALAAANEAMDRAGLRQYLNDDPSPDAERSRRVGLILGTGGGGADFTLAQAKAAGLGKRPSLWSVTNATHGNLAGELSIRLGLRGPSLCVSTGCASSSDALILAVDQLRAHRAGAPEAWVVVGADAPVNWETLVAMELLRVITTRDHRADPENAHRASRPFAQGRDGFVLGEGAWAAVVESPSFNAEREGARCGRVLGVGSTCDAFHRVRLEPEMSECARAMNLAAQDAGIGMTDIGTVAYHGTATASNDEGETRAVRMAFEDHADRLIGSSVKSMIGHPQGASGMASLVGMLGAMNGADGRTPFIPPTMHLDEPDPACDLDYCANGAQELGDRRSGLVSCLAFGGKNSMIVVEGDPT